MGGYVNIKCGSCSRSLTGGYAADFYLIGQPYIGCKKCSTPNRISEKCNEWHLLSSAREA